MFRLEISPRDCILTGTKKRCQQRQCYCIFATGWWCRSSSDGLKPISCVADVMVSGGGGNIPIGHLEDKTNVSGEEL